MSSARISRTALRQAQVREVHLFSLESLEELPADDVEIIAGDEETIITVIGAVSCAGAMMWPIGTAIFGPTCGGMILASFLV